MNWLQSLRARFASWLNPSTVPLLKSADRLLDRLDGQNQLYRAMLQQRREEIYAEITDSGALSFEKAFEPPTHVPDPAIDWAEIRERIARVEGFPYEKTE